MNAIIENTAKYFVAAMLATVATVIVGSAVAVSAGTAPAADAPQQSEGLQAHTLVARAAKQV